jgi:hypothetical protein
MRIVLVIFLSTVISDLRYALKYFSGNLEKRVYLESLDGGKRIIVSQKKPQS